MASAISAPISLTVPIAYLQDLLADRPGAGASLMAVQRLAGDVIAAEHRRIYEAIADRQPEAARQAMRLHLEGGRRRYRDWRLALARDLAREAAPKRVNVVAGPEGEARTATLRFLSDAPGVTGQYLVCHE